MQPRDLTFRVFVSSTFSDLVAERNALQQDVFPRLRDFCQKNGARFQAIDLRWGVPEEAGLDQQTMNICLEELRRCQRTSPRPNFIFLLGQRYGWCPLPWQIDAGEFDNLLTLLPEQAQHYLRQWYWRDDNAVPADYRLQPREGRFQDRAVWGAEERALRASLREAIDRIGWAATDPRRLKYETAATHQEILQGALQAKDALDHVFGFFRTIDGLPQDATARDYLDFDPQGRPDAEARGRLARLQAEMRARLPGNIQACSATWTGTGPSTDHIRCLCVDVYRRLLRVIRQEIKRRDRADPVDQEALAHSAFGQDRARHFVGREDSLARIRTYRQGDDRHPLVLHGVSGVGKSALMAKAVGQRSEVGGQSPEVVVRYIGATPPSSDLRALLEGLCKEITLRYGGDPSDVPMDVRELEQDFPKRLALATAHRPLALFLDALDQLGPADGAHRLDWLPRDLPPHVKLVVSVLDDRASEPAALGSESGAWSPPTSVFDAAHRQVPLGNLVPIEPLTADDGARLLNAWLTEARRTLQPSQRQEVLDRFAANGLPLYLKLAFEEARRWPSWQAEATPSVTLAPDIPGLLRDLFARLEQPQHHGAVLVSHALGYLAAGRHGLTEDELLDVLSADKEVMIDFIHRSRTERDKSKDQQLKSLPVLIWSRLRADIEPYLAERYADGATVIMFYHLQPLLEAQRRYLTGLDGNASHLKLADYFEGRTEMSERKISEWPWQLQQAESWARLESTLTNLDFFLALSNVDRFQFWRYFSSFPGEARDITKIYDSALSRWHRQLGDSEQYELGVNEVGHFLFVTGFKSSAARLFESAYSLAEKLYAPGDIRLAIRRNNRAAMFADQGKWREALALFLGARPVFEKEYGANHADTWVLREGLAIALVHTRQIDAGIEELNVCLQWNKRKFGTIHYAVANCLANLGVAYSYRGEFSETSRLFDSAYTTAEQSLGADNPATIHWGKQRRRWAEVAKWHARAIKRERSGKVDTALAAYRRLEDLCEQLASKPGMAVSLFGKAKLLRGIDNVAGAREVAEMARMFANDVGMQLTDEIKDFLSCQ